jgi:hypothetical protein
LNAVSALKAGILELIPTDGEAVISYEAPRIVDYGSISDHTFQTPGKGTKSATPQELDKFGEFSHLATSP